MRDVFSGEGGRGGGFGCSLCSHIELLDSSLTKMSDPAPFGLDPIVIELALLPSP